MNYEMRKIKEIGRVVTGKTPKTAISDYYNGEIMFITPTELHGNFMISNSARTLTEKGFESIKTNTISGISILVGCIGWDMGNVAMCDRKCATNQQINSVTDIKDDINPYYIYYWLKMKKDYLFSIASVTRTPILSKSAFEEIEIPVPQKEVQDAIVSVLKIIDEKIANNNKINDNLYASIEAKYNQYFLQYNFYNNNKPYKDNGGKMKWSNELNKEIPYKWSVKPLQDVCALQYGYPLSTDLFSSDGLPVIRIRDIESNSFSAKTTEQIDNCYYTEPQDLLIGMDGNFQMNFWHKSGYIVNQRITRIRRTTLPLLLIKNQIEPYIVAKSKNVARSTVGHLSDDDIKNLFILVPDDSLDISEYDLALEKIVQNINENDKLINLRNWLLPMLMNGQAIIAD